MAYELSKLGVKFQSKGLPILKEGAEATALEAYKAVKEFLKEEAALSENKIDDLVMPFLDQLDALILPQIDKIDGQVG